MSNVFQLPYGEIKIEIEIPDNLQTHLLPEKNNRTSGQTQNILVKALRKPIQTLPLTELAIKANRIGIIVNDVTRPTPTATILPIVLKEIPQAKKENITIFIATGSHRACTEKEIAHILGEGIAHDFLIVQNNALEENQYSRVGVSKFGNGINIHNKLLGCDLLVSIGFIEPHFFAGFSGGMKNILPGMANMRSIMGNHSAEKIDDPNATWGVMDGNPIWEEVNSVGLLFPQTFLINVTLNDDKKIDRIFCGDSDQAYRAGCEYVRRTSMQAVPHAFDVVVTTNSGYPLDLNLYQTVKGMSAAAQIIKPGGSIIVFSECRDGIPDHGCYRELLASAESAVALLDKIYHLAEPTPDQWQAQIQAKIQKKAEVYLYTENLSDDQVRSCLLEPFRDFSKLLENITREKGQGLSICVMPQGPLTVPYLQS